MSVFVPSPENMAIAMAVALQGKVFARFFQMDSVEVRGATMKASCGEHELEVCYGDDATKMRFILPSGYDGVQEVVVTWNKMASPDEVFGACGTFVVPRFQMD